MNYQWKNATITEICIALYVAPHTGKSMYKNRPYHGLVLNDPNSAKDYIFDDGRIMHTEGNSLFYIPKGASYNVVSLQSGGCYVINFDAEIEIEPFSLKLKNCETIKKNFKIACDEWRSNSSTRRLLAMRALYDTIYLLQKEQEQGYMPNIRHSMIAPAVELIESDFANSNLTVTKLAELCGISDVYLRKIFTHSFGISPKEYIIQKRMEYAKQLLALGDFEISSIAELCGYSEPCHFTREFKKRFGISPSKY